MPQVFKVRIVSRYPFQVQTDFILGLTLQPNALILSDLNRFVGPKPGNNSMKSLPISMLVTFTGQNKNNQQSSEHIGELIFS